MYRYGGSAYGAVTSLFPFSVGEYMLIAGTLWVILALGMLVVLGTGRLFKRFRPVPVSIKRFFCVTGLVFSAVLLIMTINCYTLYNASGLTGEDREYETDSMRALRNEVVEKACTLSGEVGRDSSGRATFQANGLDLQSAGEEARKCISSLSGDYPELSGFVVRPKPMMFSDLMSQSYMQGYYFPFSMEANVNVRMQDTHIPFTMCHELSHTKGFISEDDANFLGFLACARSEDTYFRYCAYLGVLYYVDNEYRRGELCRDSDPVITETVKNDAMFLTEEAWQQVEENAVVDTETVHKASDAFVEGNLKANGVSQGMKIYSEVVKRLLYYREKNGNLP
ncbi:MAG: DUF3810 domain-containing protein [Lachnospiraceae bacterium]|nr:DUF3810 domain-containing protein [Lachnospiraceae bacterium]